MAREPVGIAVEWDPEAAVWVATSTEVYGFVMEDRSLDALFERVPNVLGDVVAGNHPELAGRDDLHFELRVSSRPLAAVG